MSAVRIEGWCAKSKVYMGIQKNGHQLLDKGHMKTDQYSPKISKMPRLPNLQCTKELAFHQVQGLPGLQYRAEVFQSMATDTAKSYR